MNHKKIKICVVFIMIVICGLITSVIIKNKKSSEVDVARNFIYELKDNSMISTESDISKMKFTSTKKSDGAKVEGYYRVFTDTYDVEVDLNGKIIGFKNREVKEGNTEVSIDAAKAIAAKYVETILNEDVYYKEAVPEDTDVPYYTFIFTKYLNGFPCYSDDIIVNIDKSKGYLDGYSNYSSTKNPKEVSINISVSEAEAAAKNNFMLLNSNYNFVNIEGETFKAYATSKDKSESELCYIIKVIGIDSESKKVSSIYFISTETGDAINSVKNTISTTTY